MEIGIMKKGDAVLTVINDFIAVRRKCGTKRQNVERLDFPLDFPNAP